MYSLAIAASLFTIICLEAMHFITHRFGEKALTINISSPTSEQLSGIIKSIKDMGADIQLLTVSDNVATFQLHIKQKEYLSTIDKLLLLCKGLKLEIS